MPKEQVPGKPTSRRYSPEEKATAVRMVRALRAELGTEHGTVHSLARQLGYGVESVRSWVRQADIDDGYAPGVSTTEAQRVKELEQKVRELKRAIVILSRADGLQRELGVCVVHSVRDVGVGDAIGAELSVQERDLAA